MFFAAKTKTTGAAALMRVFSLDALALDADLELLFHLPSIRLGGRGVN